MVKTQDSQDQYFLNKAVQLSRENVQQMKGGPFGAVIVKNDQIIASGANTVTTGVDPTAHAEISAIRQAAKKLDDFNLSGCTVYCSCEPCPMCLSAIYWARIDRVVFANSKEQAAEIGFDDQFILKEMQKSIDDRVIIMDHRPDKDAVEVFDLWREHPGKVMY